MTFKRAGGSGPATELRFDTGAGLCPQTAMSIGNRAAVIADRIVRIAVAALLLACSRTEDAPPDYSGLGDFDTAAVLLISGTDTLHIRAEVAATEEQQKLGLMERRSLPEEQGMIFVYDSLQDAAASFWMYRTRIPLDIAFADSGGVIRAINQMEPCESPTPQLCRTYPANVPFLYALEMNHGFFASRGVGVGDTLRLRAD